LVDQVVNLVSSSIDPVEKVVDLIPSSIDPTLPSKRETQVINMSASSINQVHQVVDSISPSIDPTPPLKTKDVAHIFIVVAYYFELGGIPTVPMTRPPINAITID
jgi:hypothetical protein